MTVSRILAFPGAYRDSLLLLGATRAMQDSEDVSWASAAMATPSVVEDRDDAAGGRRGRGVQPEPRTVGEAARLLPEANVAVISVPGPYAAIAAHSALTAGLHVLLFSDNVPVSDEVALKRRASGLGRLVMGPGAGTAMLGGVGLGFANAVGSGPVGVVAAAGTGAEEVMTLLDRPDAELPGWYAAADVLAFPSTKEGWGLAVLEAMSAGLPVVASDLPVFREYLRPGQDALMVPVDDAAALAAALGAVLDDAALAGRLRAAGHEVCARFTWERCAAEHQRIYADLKWG